MDGWLKRSLLFCWFNFADWGKRGTECDGRGQQSGIRLQLSPAVPPQQDPGCWGTNVWLDTFNPNMSDQAAMNKTKENSAWHSCAPASSQESLDKQTQYAQTLSEKLWLAERQLEELQIDKDTKEKKSSELQSTILKLETEVDVIGVRPS